MDSVKSLFASPVGDNAKDNLRKIVRRFGHTSFDFLLLVYDNSRYDEACFANCTVVYDRSPLFWQLKKHLTPELCRKYEYVFIWMDDLDILDFDPENFLNILRRHGIEVGHPSLSANSVISHPIMAHRPDSLGRYTDFVEQMAMVFRGDCWSRFWDMISPTENPWGWGYDEAAYSYCGYRKMAVIDSETIRHLRKGTYAERARADQKRFHQAHRRLHFSRKRTLCRLSEQPTMRWAIAPLRLGLYRAFVKLYVLLGLGHLR